MFPGTQIEGIRQVGRFTFIPLFPAPRAGFLPLDLEQRHIIMLVLVILIMQRQLILNDLRKNLHAFFDPAFGNRRETKPEVLVRMLRREENVPRQQIYLPFRRQGR